MNYPENSIVAMYLDWVNNFLTVRKFAEYYGISRSLALAIIAEGRALHEANCPKPTSSQVAGPGIP